MRTSRSLAANACLICANNYLGLADHPAPIAVKEALDTHGFGMASVRFICGRRTFTKTRSRAHELPRDRGHDLYPSCFDATAASSKHCSQTRTLSSATIEPREHHRHIRLCKAQRCHKHNDMADSKATARRAKCALIDRDRRLLLDGRNDRELEGNRGSRREI